LKVSAKVTSSASAHEAEVRTDGRARTIPLPARDGGGSAVNGGELLMLALATCYCNDVFREAVRLGVPVEGVEVEASAVFSAPGAGASDVCYRATVRSSAPSEEVAKLLREADAVAEVHKSLRIGTYVGFDAPVSRPSREAAPAGAPEVTLREITAETVRGVVRLSVAPGQDKFVAPNAVSLAQALFSPEAWYRAAYRGEELVGFVMLEDQAQAASPPAKPQIGLWRLMVDQRFQGQGIGRGIVQRAVEHARFRGYDKLYTSYVPGEDGPEAFYRGLGFMPTGEVDHGEVVAALAIPR
jgi:diamine N-acetyltransferase